MAIAGSCVPTMEKPCLCITASLGSATLVYTQNTRKGHTGRLASLASHRSGRYRLITSHGQHHRSTGAEQSCMSSLPLGSCGSAIGRSLGTDACVIPRVDRIVSLVVESCNTTCHSRYLLGRICPTSANPRLEFHSISGNAETTFVSYSPSPPFPL